MDHGERTQRLTGRTRVPLLGDASRRLQGDGHVLKALGCGSGLEGTLLFAAADCPMVPELLNTVLAWMCGTANAIAIGFSRYERVGMDCTYASSSSEYMNDLGLGSKITHTCQVEHPAAMRSAAEESQSLWHACH
jgi:hypothetical protein